VVEYIRGLREPTATDADGNRITWIEQMESLVLKPDVSHQHAIEEARLQLERTLRVEATTDTKLRSNIVVWGAEGAGEAGGAGGEKVTSSNATRYDKAKELDVQLRAMRLLIGAIGLSDAAIDRVMERLNTRLKLELGLQRQDSGGYLWETVGSVHQGRLF
jgi:hypothetical protein